MWALKLLPQTRVPKTTGSLIVHREDKFLSYKVFETSVNASLRSVNEVHQDILNYFVNVKKLGVRKLTEIGIKRGSIENRWKMLKAFLEECAENFSLVTLDNFSVIIRDSSRYDRFNELTKKIIKKFKLSEDDVESAFLHSVYRSNFEIADILLEMLSQRKKLEIINNSAPNFMWKDSEKEKVIKYFLLKGLISFDPMPPKYSGKIIKFMQNSLFAFSTETMEEILKTVTVFDPYVLKVLPNVGSLSFSDKIKILSENQPFIKMCLANPIEVESENGKKGIHIDEFFTGTLKNLWRGRHLARKINL